MRKLARLERPTEAEAELENDATRMSCRPRRNSQAGQPTTVFRENLSQNRRAFYGRFREAGTVLGIRLRDHKPLVLAAISHCC